MATCEFVHYELDIDPVTLEEMKKAVRVNFVYPQLIALYLLPFLVALYVQPVVTLPSELKLMEPQWINADVRKLDFKLLGAGAYAISCQCLRFMSLFLPLLCQ